MANIARRVLTRNGIQYFDAGGNVLPLTGSFGGSGSPQVAQPAGVGASQQSGGLFSPLTSQNGYNAQLAPTAQSDYGGLVSNAGTNANAGFGQFNENAQQQQGLIDALNRTANGQGPNPAQAQLNQNTGANVSNTAALIAGQRGVSSNPGLAAREIAGAGAATQQNAVGQAATLQASQELAAQQAALSGQQGLGQQIVGEQNANTGLFTGAAGAQNSQNTGNINNYAQAQGINGQVSQANANATNQTTGGVLGGIASGFGLFAKGGKVLPAHFRDMAKLYHPHLMHYDEGGMIQIPTISSNAQSPWSAGGKKGGPKSSSSPQTKTVGDSSTFSSTGSPMAGDQGEGMQESATDSTTGAASDQVMMAADGGEIDSNASSPWSFGKSGGGGGGGIMSMLPMLAAALKSGGKVPGKAKVKGNSYQNDTVPALVSPGEIVLPRSVTEAADAPEKARQFVQKLQGKYGKSDNEDEADFRGALKKAISSRKGSKNAA